MTVVRVIIYLLGSYHVRVKSAILGYKPKPPNIPILGLGRTATRNTPKPFTNDNPSHFPTPQPQYSNAAYRPRC